MIVPSTDDVVDEGASMAALATRNSFNRSSSFSKSVAEAPSQLSKGDSLNRVNSSGLVSQLSGGLLSSSTTKQAEKDNTPKLKLKGFADWRDRGPDDDDWFGNLALHHAFSNRDDICVKDIKRLSVSYPQMNNAKNQFGRIPLHYAVDRLKCNYDAIKVLVDSYPKGVSEEDNEGISPFDLCVKWGHPNNIIRLMVHADPNHDRNAYLRCKYGCVGAIYCYLFNVPGRKKLVTEYQGVSKYAEDDESSIEEEYAEDETHDITDGLTEQDEVLNNPRDNVDNVDNVAA